MSNADATLHLTDDDRAALETAIDLLQDSLEALFAGKTWTAQSLAYRVTCHLGLIPPSPWA